VLEQVLVRRRPEPKKQMPGRGPLRWYLLIHQLPPRPLYLRAKIRQRLAKVGAIALKSSVYALPRREECLEDFEWIAEEASAGGGEAWICEAAFPDRKVDEELVRRSSVERDSEYAALAREARAASREADIPVRLARARKRLEEIERIDFFAARGRKTAKASIEGLLKRLERRGETMKSSKKTRTADLVGRTWVTRRGVKVDRISSAWFVRRFIDPKARFRFIDPKNEEVRAGELGFDLVGGEFTHEGDRCTLETIVRRTEVEDPALRPIVQIVHDIDLKDAKFGRPETAGVSQLLAGLFAATSEDERRLERGFALFDDLYTSFRKSKATP
jgi:hypothetical protein